MSGKTMAEVLEELWDGGNATGLDGWIGPGRGAGEVDDHAIDTRRRDVEKALAALSAAGVGLVADAGSKALDDAADSREVDPATSVELFTFGLQTRQALRARAAAVRGEG